MDGSMHGTMELPKNQPDDDTNTSIQDSLRQIEAGLEASSSNVYAPNNNNSTGGRTAWASVGSALASLRERLRRRGGGEAPPSDDVSERLRVAELAHATRTPLTRLRTELERRQSTTTSPPLRLVASTGGRRAPMTPPSAADEDEETTMSSSSSKRRRKSEYLASRTSPKAAAAVNRASELEEQGREEPKQGIDDDDERLHRRLSTTIRVLSDISEEPNDGADSMVAPAAQKMEIEEKEESPPEMDIEVVLQNPEQPETNILLGDDYSQSLESVHRSVLFRTTSAASSSIHLDSMVEDDDGDQPTNEPQQWFLPQVYSWGATVHSLYDSAEDEGGDHADLEPIGPSSRIGRTHVVGVATSVEHSAVVTNTGNVYTCGINSQGQVDPSKPIGASIPKPTLLESLTVPIVQVSCGRDHTAAVTATGTVLTWGSSRENQLGHRVAYTDDAQRILAPRAMALGQRRAAAVSCGDGFTMVLTSRMQVLVCGKRIIAGYHHARCTHPHLPALLPELFGLPITHIAAGHDHAVVVTCHGTPFVWGSNEFGQCGQEYPRLIQVPNPMRMPTGSLTKKSSRISPLPPMEFSVVRAACGSHHTVLVTKKGQLMVCGKNDKGQLGIAPTEAEGEKPPDAEMHLEMLSHLESPDTSFVAAVAGDSHTLVLDSDQNVWKLTRRGMQCVLRDRWIVSIAAGGHHSVAISDIPRDAPPTSSLVPLPQPVHRAFSQVLADARPALDATKQLTYHPSAAEASSSKNSHLLEHSMEDLVLAVGGNKVSGPLEEAPAATLLSETAVRELANRAEELLQCPAVLNGLFLDPLELDLLYDKVLTATTDHSSRQMIANSIEKGMFAGLESLETESGHASLKFPESVRFLLLYLQCPLFLTSSTDEISFDRRGDLMLLLCEQFLGLSYEGYRAMVAWVTSLYTRRDVFVKCLVKPLLKQLERGLEEDAGPAQRAVPLVATVLKLLYITSDRAGGIANDEDFWSRAVENRDPRLAFQDLHRWKTSDKRQRSANFYICNHSFLFSPSMKRNLLAIENEMEMVQTATRDGVRYNMEDHTIEFNPYWVLDVDREHMLTQTLQKVGSAKSTDLRKKLKVVFKGEDGVDAGGVTREFFQLLCAQLFDISSGMWSDRFDEEDITWFNPDCFWNDEGFYLVGILVGLAVYNSVLLDVRFPQAVYRKLLGLPLGLEDMVDSRLRTSLQQLLDYEGDDVEDVFCLTFSLSWMDLGTERTVELKPGGEDMPVTSENKEEYVQLYVKWLLEESIHAQYDGFERGFMKVMENSTLDFMSPAELELLVVGSPELDFEALEENTTYEGYEKDDAVIQHLWSFLKHADEDTKLMFLKFTTGSSRAPIGGLGQLHFKIQKNGEDSMQLPTSHTCFNTLLLPDYGDNFDKVAERMGRAVLECEGFGLQ